MKWKKDPIANISAYMPYTSRGNIFDIKIPDDPRAIAAYERGKKHFYQKRGQLNMACADCHKFYAGSMVSADLLSPALGHLTHFRYTVPNGAASVPPIVVTVAVTSRYAPRITQRKAKSTVPWNTSTLI